MNKNLRVLFLGLIIVAVVVVVLVFSGNAKQGKKLSGNLSNNINTNNQNQMGNNKLPAGLEVTDEIVGMGTEAMAQNIVTVNYIGTLTNGTKFDSSYDRNRPFLFALGAGQVIRGWDEGIVGMRVGGKRKFVIPPDLAYGDQNIGNGLIPPNSTLVFEVELLSVQAQ